jgi:mannose-6-phosphate isomerase-like protein (cupin superfamily)
MTDLSAAPPARVDPLAISSTLEECYANLSLCAVNDHEIRLSVMTAPFRWHAHPDSDETFLVIDGELVIEFEGRQVTLHPGQLLTVPAGTRHRTRPAGPRSANLTFERRNAATVFDEE